MDLLQNIGTNNLPRHLAIIYGWKWAMGKTTGFLRALGMREQNQ
jgi:hypothetical protein